jgi:hypothetical protein
MVLFFWLGGAGGGFAESYRFLLKKGEKTHPPDIGFFCNSFSFLSLFHGKFTSLESTSI